MLSCQHPVRRVQRHADEERSGHEQVERAHSGEKGEKDPDSGGQTERGEGERVRRDAPRGEAVHERAEKVLEGGFKVVNALHKGL